MKAKKKLIEVALPLDAVNKASAREKSLRHGHPSTLHLWWARRPLAAARAVIFAQMVDDPSSNPDLFPTEKTQEKERRRLFRIIEDLVQWENTTNQTVLQAARDEIWQSWRRACAENADHPRAKELFDRSKLPAFHDPFAGGGALPLEAQRLGLEAYASDLNPVAVLINKAMIEFPPKFAGRPPVNPKSRADPASGGTWRGAAGLAEDVRFYGQWMRDEAEKEIGHLYPKVRITAEMVNERPDLRAYVGRDLTVIAWLWARTVRSPNPAYAGLEVPLASTFMLFKKPGKEAYVEPEISKGKYLFKVRVGKPADAAAAETGTKLARGASFRCLMSGVPITGDYIKAEGRAGRIGVRLMGVVAEGDGSRVYLSPTDEMELLARSATPLWSPEGYLVEDARAFTPTLYGLRRWSDLFTPRQLVALETFTRLLNKVRENVTRDAMRAGEPDDGKFLRDGGSKVTAYAEAISVYLAFNVSKLSDLNNSLVTWKLDRGCPVHLFARQAIPMVWDFPEANPFSSSSGSWESVHWHLMTSTTEVCLPAFGSGHAWQEDAATSETRSGKVVSTDPPYYDNVPYADLSDFFYVWLRRSLRTIFPDLFDTLAVPKAQELVATRYRHGSKEQAEAFFLEGMSKAMQRLAEQSHPVFPITLYYAFKQSEGNGAGGSASTGWETFLDAVIRAGFAITGTWPIRTELANRIRGMDSNALASSIVLVCRRRPADAAIVTRREFRAALRHELSEAVMHLQRGNIAPVDLAQAAIGPGMAVFTRYSNVVDASGEAMKVREALTVINEVLDESLAEQEGDFDADSRWALAWFEQSAFEEGDYGVAETLSKAKNTSVRGLEDAGILKQGRGKVRLLRVEELPSSWDPTTDSRLSAWESVHHLIRALSSGEKVAADLVAKLGAKAEIARELAYRLYVLCERKKRPTEALAYNGLVQSWPEIARLAREKNSRESVAPQTEMFEQEAK